jgi:hypothetical protein
MVTKKLQSIALKIPDMIRYDEVRAWGYTLRWGTTFVEVFHNGEFFHGSGSNTPFPGTVYFERGLEIAHEHRHRGEE